MKNFLRLICIVLSLSICMALPASADAGQNARASDYFHQISTYINRLNNTQFEVWFDLICVDRMDEIGASKITVQRSTDGTNWQNMFTYRSEHYPQMIAYNTVSHGACIPYHGTLGYYYRGVVTFYAKNSSGIGEMYRYTNTVYLQPSN